MNQDQNTIPTGWAIIDKITDGGFRQGELVVLSGGSNESCAGRRFPCGQCDDWRNPGCPFTVTPCHH